jgi:hypothetical protein
MVGSVHDRTRSVQGAADAWVHGVIEESAGLQQRATIGFAASFGLSALVLSAAGDGSPVAAMLVAASAGAVVGLGNRLWMAIAGLALIGWAASPWLCGLRSGGLGDVGGAAGRGSVAAQPVVAAAARNAAGRAAAHGRGCGAGRDPCGAGNRRGVRGGRAARRRICGFSCGAGGCE